MILKLFWKTSLRTVQQGCRRDLGCGIIERLIGCGVAGGRGSQADLVSSSGYQALKCKDPWPRGLSRSRKRETAAGHGL